MQAEPPPTRGVLMFRVCEARGLTSPPGFATHDLPQHLQTTGTTQQQQRRSCWWLPYAVLDFDNNVLVIDALGGDVANPTWNYRANFDVSRVAEAVVSVFLRGKPPEATKGTMDSKGGACSGPSGEKATSSESNGDVFLGRTIVQPDFVDGKVVDQWFPLTNTPPASGRGTGSVPTLHMQFMFQKENQQAPISIDSFDLLKVLGKGSFGKVMQVRKRDTNRIYAMKIIRKQHIIERAEVDHTLAERTVLARINNPFIIPLKFSFQTPEKLYLGLAFVNGGELFHHLQKEGHFDEHRSRFYAAELLCALECLHSMNVIYRDLKPENILLDCSGHIALCDFGLCKLNMTESDRAHTFCGTPEYLAPELLMQQGYTKTVDWWTLGILLYEMLTGLPPFYDEVVNQMYVKILQQELCFPDHMSSLAKSLLTGMLTRDPNRRLGAKGAEEIKAHPFFAEIDWVKLKAKKVIPPFKPSVQSAVDTSNFDDEFTNEVPQDSVVPDSLLSATAQNQFAGFTYDAAKDNAMAQSMGTSYTNGRSIREPET